MPKRKAPKRRLRRGRVAERRLLATLETLAVVRQLLVQAQRIETSIDAASRRISAAAARTLELESLRALTEAICANTAANAQLGARIERAIERFAAMRRG